MELLRMHTENIISGLLMEVHWLFSFMGFTTQEVVPTSNKSTIDVKMDSDVKQLTEVVITAARIERDKKP